METIITPEGKTLYATYFGWVSQEVKEWLLRNRIFNFETQAGIAEECFLGRKKKSMGDSLERDWTCLGVNVIDNAIQEDRKMLAMVYHCTGKDKITKNDILEYIRQNNLFPEMKRKYCEARSIDLFN